MSERERNIKIEREREKLIVHPVNNYSFFHRLSFKSKKLVSRAWIRNYSIQASRAYAGLLN
jgi:hypothetical protein